MENDQETYGITRILGQIALSPALIAAPGLAKDVYMRTTVRLQPKRRPTLDDAVLLRTEGSFSLLLSLPVEIQMDIIDIIEEAHENDLNPTEQSHPLIALRAYVDLVVGSRESSH